MASPSDWANDWPLLSDARDRLEPIIAAAGEAAPDLIIDHANPATYPPDEEPEPVGVRLAIAAFQDVIGRGEVPVIAVRDDCGSITPQRIEPLLAAAKNALFYTSINEIDAYFDSFRDRAIFGSRSDLIDVARYPPAELNGLQIRLSDVRVHWPALVKALAAVGFTDGTIPDDATAPVESRPSQRTMEPMIPGKPGPKGREQSIDRIAWQIALEILTDDGRRPPRGYGRLTTLARLVNGELARRGHRLLDESIRRKIQASVREWEGKNPDK
jgi:hypothetical protein